MKYQLLTLTLLFLGCGAEEQATNQSTTDRQPNVVNGSLCDQPSVGFFLAERAEGKTVASGTRIGQRWVLTARHVTATAGDLFNNARNAPFRIGRVIPHPEVDAALVSVTPVVADFDDRRLSSLTRRAPERGMAITLIGDGKGLLAEPLSTRCASSSITLLYEQSYTFIGVWWNRGMICAGDSGGPSFTAVDGAQRQVGVHSIGSDNCLYYGNDVRVDGIIDWIIRETNNDVCVDGIHLSTGSPCG